MKVILKEKQLEALLKRNILESVQFGSSSENEETKGGNAFATRNVGRVLQYVKDMYNSDNEEDAEKRDNLRHLAKVNGINFDYDEEEHDRRLKELVDNENREMVDWVCDNLDELRSYYYGKKVKRNKEQAYRDNDGKIKTKMTNMANTMPKEAEERLLNLASFLDKMQLSMLYRDYEKPASVNVSCGLRLSNVNKTTPVEYLRKHLNFGAYIQNEYQDKGILDSEIFKNYNGTVVGGFNREAGFDTDKPLSGTSYEKVKPFVARGLMEKRARRYLNMTYGVDLSFGNNDMFKFGNTKISTDTLIINFASAIRCPAWNECIMKDACYAKTSEVNYDDCLSSNLKKNLIWEQTKIDKTLMAYMMGLIRSYLIDYSQLKCVKAQKKDNRDEFMWNLCQMSLRDLENKVGEDEINVLKDTRKGSLIRLNENGDFIGQWLVDAFDEFANELKLVDIHVTAYTCRALNYESVKDLILNISQEGLVRGQKSEGIAHYFYAIDERDYASLGETYGGPNFELDFNASTKKITPVYRRMVDEDGTLKGYYYKCPCGRGKYQYKDYVFKNGTNYVLLCLDSMNYNEANGTLYGKAVIDGKEVDARFIGTSKLKGYLLYDRSSGTLYRKNGNSKSYSVVEDDDAKFGFGHGYPVVITETSPEIYVDVDNEKMYKKVKADKSFDVADCYMCRICYARDADKENGVRFEGGKKEGNVPVYVFVATHGSNKNEFQYNDNNSKGEDNDVRKIDGKTPREWARILNNANSTSRTGAINENEFGEQPQSDERAIKCIVRNFISSVSNHMRGNIGQLNEIKNNFNSFLKRING